MGQQILWRPHKDPWHPPDHDESVVYALRALAEGVANAGQQKLMVDYFRYITGLDDMSYRPGEEGRRDTDFAEGKRFVGRELFKLLHPLYTPNANKKSKRLPLAQQRLRNRKREPDAEEQN